MIGPRISSHGVQQAHVQATSGQSRRIVPLHHAPAPRVKRARSRSTVASRSLLPREPLQGCIVYSLLCPLTVTLLLLGVIGNCEIKYTPALTTTY